MQPISEYVKPNKKLSDSDLFFGSDSDVIKEVNISKDLKNGKNPVIKNPSIDI